MPIAEYTIPGMHMRDHLVPVPLDWSRPDGATSHRGVRARGGRPGAPQDDDLPLLVFLQGGPGGKSPRPVPGSPPWLAEALKTHRVILPDQRGTGRSTRIESATMAQFADGEAAADYLALFRADFDRRRFRACPQNPVRRQAMGIARPELWRLPDADLSFARRPRRSAPATSPAASPACGPRPTRSIGAPIRAPPARRRATTSASRTTSPASPRSPTSSTANDVRLPDGDRLTVKRLQTVGIDLGMAPGFENVHWLIDEAFSSPGRLSDHFLAAVMAPDQLRWRSALRRAAGEHLRPWPGATGWAAERVRAEHPAFARRPGRCSSPAR